MNSIEVSIPENTLGANDKVKEFFKISHEDLNNISKQWPVGSCSEAEGRWVSIFNLQMHESGEVIHPIIGRSVATTILGSIHDPENWLSLPLTVQTLIMVKNQHSDPICQSVIGERNALIVLNDIAFIGLMDSDVDVKIIRPCMLSYQTELIKKYAQAMSTIQLNMPKTNVFRNSMTPRQ